MSRDSEERRTPKLTKLASVAQQVTQRVTRRAEQFETLRSELQRRVHPMNLRGEIQGLLSQIAIDVTLTIKLAPQEDAPLGVAPQVKASAQVRLDPTATPESNQEDVSKPHQTKPHQSDSR